MLNSSTIVSVQIAYLKKNNNQRNMIVIASLVFLRVDFIVIQSLAVPTMAEPWVFFSADFLKRLV